MITYLHHPVHGKKVAYLPAEVAADKARGWTERREEPAPVSDVAPPLPKRRGRPPKAK